MHGLLLHTTLVLPEQYQLASYGTGTVYMQDLSLLLCFFPSQDAGTN